MVGFPGETEAVCAEQRRNYTSGEARRVGVSFAVAAKDAHSSVILGAQDTDKTIAASKTQKRIFAVFLIIFFTSDYFHNFFVCNITDADIEVFAELYFILHTACNGIPEYPHFIAEP